MERTCSTSRFLSTSIWRHSQNRGMKASPNQPLRIAIIGDYQRNNVTHTATDAAIEHTTARLGLVASAEWVATDVVGDPARTLAAFQALWIAPGSPYRSLEGALDAIRYAR